MLVLDGSVGLLGLLRSAALDSTPYVIRDMPPVVLQLTSHSPFQDQTSQDHCFDCPVRGAFSPIGSTSALQCSNKPGGGLTQCKMSGNTCRTYHYLHLSSLTH